MRHHAAAVLLLAAATMGAMAPTSALAQTTDSAGVLIVDSTMLRASGARSVAEALAGKVAGARVITLSGIPGRPPAIVLRNAGANHITDPLILIDGVVSRVGLADIHIEDVARIEILRGPATAAAYGIGAATGVVNVVTRRPAPAPDGVALVHLRSELGFTAPRASRLATSGSHPYQLNGTGTDFLYDANGNRILEADGIADNPYPRRANPSALLLGGGATASNHLSATDRFGRVTATGSLHHERDPGVLERVQPFSRRGGRLALDATWFERLTVRGDALLASSTGDFASASDYLLIEPHARLDSVMDPCPTGPSCYVQQVPMGRFNTVNPLWAMDALLRDVKSDRRRAGAHASWAFQPWLSAYARHDRDSRSTDESSRVFGVSGSTLVTGPELVTRVSTEGSASAVGVNAGRELRDGLLHARTRVEYGAERRRSALHSFTDGMRGGGSERRFDVSHLLAATTLDVGARATLTGSFRHDRPSHYGRHNEQDHFNATAEYRFTDGLRVRAAHGTSSPDLPDISETFAVGPGTQPAPLLLPVTRESEGAVQLPLWGGARAARMEYSYSRQHTRNAVDLVAGPATLGFNWVWLNVGDVAGDAHELTLTLPVVRRAGFAWDVSVNAHRGRARVERLVASGGYLAQLGSESRTIIVEEGMRIDAIQGRRWIRTQQQLEETLLSGALGGASSDYVLNGDGYYVRASQHRTAAEVPLQYVRCAQGVGTGCVATPRHELGFQSADAELGVHSAARWRGLNARVTLTGAIGGEAYNAERHLAFLMDRAGEVDQAGRPELERKGVGFYRAIGSSVGQPDEHFIESATHLKVRELALEWTPPRRAIPAMLASSGVRVGLVARNLWTFGAFQGNDADVTAISARLGMSRMSGFDYPSYRTFAAVVRVDR